MANDKTTCCDAATTDNKGAGCCCEIGGWGSDRTSALVLRLVILLAAAMLCCLPLTGDLYGDEGHTFRTVSIGDLMENLNQPNSCHPPLFFALAKGCWQLTGRPWAIRIPSLLAAIGTMILVWPLTRRLLGERYVTAALLLAGFSPLLVEFATEARPYAMLAFFSTALLWLMARFLDKETWLDAAALAVVASLGLMTHFIFAAQLVFAACWYLWRRRKLTRYSIAALALFAPVGYYLVTGATDDAGFSKSFTESWRQKFSWLNFLGRMPFAMTFGYCTFRLGELGATRQVGREMILANWPLVSAAAAFFVGLAGGLVRLFTVSSDKRRLAGLLAAAVAIPLFVGLLGGKAGFYLLREKYFIGSLAAYLLLILLCMDSLVRRWKICVIFVIAYAVVAGVSLYHFAARPQEFSRRTFRSDLNAALIAEADEGDLIACYFINRVEPWYFTAMDEFDRVIDLREALGEKAPAEKIEALARTLDDSTPGSIFLVSREMDRNAVDPKNRLLAALEQLRRHRVRYYGRNLLLYVFEPHAPAEGAGQ